MTDLTKRHAELLVWAQSCLDARDFHGLRDCAADLEVVEARMEERGPSLITTPWVDCLGCLGKGQISSGICGMCGGMGQVRP